MLTGYLAEHWFAGLVFLAAVVAGLAVFWRRGRLSVAPFILPAAGAAFGLGGLVLANDAAPWVAGGAGVVLFGMLVWLVLSGQWLAPVAAAVAAILAFGLGGSLAEPIGSGMVETVKAIRSLEAVQPIWLLLLLLVPLIVFLSLRSLAGLGPVRRWVAIGLRSLLIILLTLALAEVRIRRPNENTTVLFLVDRSLSIPQEIDSSVSEDRPIGQRDKRWRRVKQFVNEAVEKRGTNHARDQAGVIAFGRRPRLVLPAGEVPKLNFSEEIIGGLDENYTDIAAAIKLALASFPEGTAKRIVLISDGNENLGNAEEQARIAAQNGVQIDTVPLAAGYRNENEVLVERVEAPPITEQGGRLPIRVLIRSYNPRMVTGTLGLRQISEGESEPVGVEVGPGVKEVGPPAVVQLKPGLNSFSFKQSLAGVQRSYTYQAIFQPLEVQGDQGEVIRGLPGDRVQNNSATTHVVALGRRRVLLVEKNPRPSQSDFDHSLLITKLQGTGDKKFQITPVFSRDLPVNKADLGVLLSNYDCVILANVPAEELTDDQQEMIRSNTYDQGCGLVVLGGQDSYGAGGYQGTPVEKALPVDCDIKSIKVAGKGGLVLIMHASEAADGNALQKQIAKIAIQKLSAVDMVGMIYYDFNHKWHIPFQTIGGQRGSLVRQVDRMTPGDMPDFDPALQMALKELSNPTHQLATKHIILISDGDPSLTNMGLITQMRQAGVTCTTVGVATHGAPEAQKMGSIATGTGGRFYKDPNPKAIPAIYIQETRLVSQSFVFDQRFQPQLRSAGGPTDKLSPNLPPLYGFVRTSLKQSPLVEMAIEGPSTLDQRFPVLAYWQYGLGKSVAYTSDALSKPGRPSWDRDWAESDIYLKFWEQVVGWALRGVETGKLSMSTEYRDGQVRVTVDARDERGKPIGDLRLQGGVTAPGGVPGEKPIELKFDQKNSGQYEATFKAEEAGSYFINALARRFATETRNGKEVQVEQSDSIRSGVTIPYSPEFADLESNTALLRKLSDVTGGTVFTEDDAELAKVVKDAAVFRSAPLASRSPQTIWYWLVLVAGIGLFFDVAVRRIAMEPAEIVAASTKVWNRLRGRAEAKATTPQFLDRLQNRKAQVAETLEGTFRARRFDPESAPAASSAPPVLEVGMAPPRRVVEAPPTLKPTEAADDAFARLMKAKKKALEGRESGKDALQ